MTDAPNQQPKNELLDPQVIANFVTKHYNIVPPITCSFIGRGFNDHYLQEKMQEYLGNGVRLGWLIEPKAKTVEIYRLGQAVEILQNPKTVSGEDVLPGFVLNLEPIWS